MTNWIRRNIQQLRRLPEDQLVRQIQQGNKEAFGKLYLKYLDSIYRYIFFRVHQDSQIAEDLTEVVFTKALQSIDKFNQTNGNFRAWLYRIAHNTVIDYYRTYKSTLPLEEDVNNISSQDNLQTSFEREEDIKNLMQAIDTLTDDQKTVITLRFIEGSSNSEIAEVLEKNEEAVRALQYRALKTLRIKLNHHE